MRRKPNIFNILRKMQKASYKQKGEARMRRVGRHGLAMVALSLAATRAAWPGGAASSDWPMLAHDAARSGATATEIRPPFERKWYRIFPEEGLMAGVQPVVAGGRVFVGTLAGVVHAVDAETSGRIRPAVRFCTPSPSRRAGSSSVQRTV
jgi:hypothetical protein